MHKLGPENNPTLSSQTLARPQKLPEPDNHARKRQWLWPLQEVFGRILEN